MKNVRIRFSVSKKSSGGTNSCFSLSWNNDEVGECPEEFMDVLKTLTEKSPKYIRKAFEEMDIDNYELRGDSNLYVK